MNNSNRIKSSQLKMPYGTAANLLRKSIMYKLVCDSKLNVCHRCGKIIADIEEFSIDHKTPWLYSKNPILSFFDLDNIAFSHTACNFATHRRKKHAKGVRNMNLADGKHRKRPWRVEIRTNYKQTTVGYFATKKEATDAYKKRRFELEKSN